MMLLLGRAARNLRRVLYIRDEAASAVEAFARIFLDGLIEDDGTPAGRLRALLVVTEHRFVPGLHQGIRLGLTGFRPEYQDPWPASTDQVGHFLTAVRLTFDARFLRFPGWGLLLGSLGHADVPLRLMIGHEKAPDPADISEPSLRSLFRALQHFRRQYVSTTAEDVSNFRDGKLEAIKIGGGIGNSIADLRLTYTGWQFGGMMAAGHFASNGAVADWIRSELGDGTIPKAAASVQAGAETGMLGRGAGVVTEPELPN